MVLLDAIGEATTYPVENKVKLKKETECLADKGYQGIQKLHLNSQLPKKKPKGKQLSQLDREKNQKLERVRGICERVIGRLKVFKILAERYQNRRKRFGLRNNADSWTVQL